MGASFVLFTGFEIILAVLLILGFKNEKKLIRFENHIFSLIKKKKSFKKENEKRNEFLKQKAIFAKEQARLRIENMPKNSDIIPLHRNPNHVA